MSAINRTAPRQMVKTFEGASVPKLKDAEKILRRVTMASMLWEKQFYMDGESSYTVLQNAVANADADTAQRIAAEARSKYKLRHVPLAIMRELARTGRMTASALAEVIQRPDEIGEFISLYWKDKKQPLSNQVKKGLAKAFSKFNEYQFAKWDKNSSAVKLRDAMFLVHAKPEDETQATLFAKIADNKLTTPDTWETNLSMGADKKGTFIRLMNENKLGALAFLRNLRNMVEAGVPAADIQAYGERVNTDRVLPFRFLAAARVVPAFRRMLEQMMLRSLKEHEKLPGTTALLIDVSGSMFGPKVSDKSDLDRFDAAAALAMLASQICENVEIYTFSNKLVRVPNVPGFSLVDMLRESQPHSGTRLGAALQDLKSISYPNRIIVFTDEQTSDKVPAPKGNSRGYIINVANYENGINHGEWDTITGFSEAVIDYIQESEKYTK